MAASKKTQNKREFRAERTSFEKNLLKGIKNLIKGTSWRMKQNAIFCDEDGVFVEAFIWVSFLERKTTISISSKPMSLDRLYWSITRIEENNSEPLSFRSWGAFTCPSLPLEEIIFEDDLSCADQMLEKMKETFFKKTETLISDFSNYSFSNSVATHKNQVERGAYSISLVASLIDEEKFEQAYSLAKKYLAGDLESCHNHTHVGKDFNELAIEWLNNKGYVT